MSLLGLDIGTSGCKAVAFDLDGRIIASAYEEYDVRHGQPGWAELDAAEVWGKIKTVLGKVAAATARDPAKAISFSSLGEATVPVTADRKIAGPSLLCMDTRGAEYVERLRSALSDEKLYAINGNTLGNNYGLTKLLWLKEHRPDLFRAADKFLPWGSFVSFMLGAEPIVDYSLANRILLFDIEKCDWSDALLGLTGIERDKLPATTATGTVVGALGGPIARELGLPAGIPLIAGAHDQCMNSVGCGVIDEGRAMYGMGTFICAVPVFARRAAPEVMIPRGLCTEHHAARDRFVSFIYNQGGVLLKWCRDTMAAADHRAAKSADRDVYDDLMREMPAEPGKVMVLPHFSGTGPPAFIEDTAGVIAGLHLDTSRGGVIKGVLEGATYYIHECLDTLPSAGIEINDFRAVGGGSKSDAWVQLSADIVGKPFVRPRVTEAGALGAAIVAGTGCGVFGTLQEGVERLVALDRTFEPDARRHAIYDERFAKYRRLYPLMREYLKDI